MISASHNPYADNGIKFFGGDGFKLSDETEREIELHLEEDLGGGGQQIGRIAEMPGTADDYLARAAARASPTSTSRDSTSSSTAPTARPSWSRRRSSAASARA